jgi:hypothetical protein
MPRVILQKHNTKQWISHENHETIEEKGDSITSQPGMPEDKSFSQDNNPSL